MTFELDITNFLQKVKERGYSFTIAMVYAVCKCANEIEEFRYGFFNGKVVLFDKIDTAFTYLNTETELFKVVNVLLGNDVVQCSPIPLITFTHISHTNSGKKDNATPLFDWGKYCEKDGKVFLPFAIQAHHSFVDGIHVGKLAEKVLFAVN